jgi:hypothetical protein
MYMPRNDFADFLLYVPEGRDTVYVVSRGKIPYDTAWAAIALEPYKDSWQLLKESTAALFKRNLESLSKQLRRVLAEAAKRNLPCELISTKRSEQRNDYRRYAQRRILVKDKRCAIYMATLLPNHDQAWDGGVFRVPKDDWAEVLLYIVDEDIYVVPREEMLRETSLSFDSNRIRPFRNSWCVLDGVDPRDELGGRPLP